jgi:hypothetical protein
MLKDIVVCIQTTSREKKKNINMWILCKTKKRQNGAGLKPNAKLSTCHKKGKKSHY